MKTKILFYLPDLEGGGAERVTLTIIEQLDKTIFDVYLVLGKKNGDLENQLPKNIHIVSLNVHKTLFAFIPLLKQCRKIKPLILFSSLSRANILLICISKFLRSSITIIREPNTPNNQIKLLPKSTMAGIKYFYPKADYVIAQTEDMRIEMIKHYKIKPHKIYTLTNPLNTLLIDDLTNGKISPYPKGSINIVAIGSLIKRKGFDVLIKSFKQINYEYNNTNLYILGKGVERENLQQLAAQYDLYKKIHFEGFQQNPYPYIKYADYFILSSKAEGLPNTVLESLYLQTRVIVTNCVPYISDLVTQGSYGYVAEVDNIQDLADKIRLAIRDKGKQPPLTYNPNKFRKFFSEIVHEI